MEAAGRKGVFVCSTIKGLLPALRKAVPSVSFVEIPSDDLGRGAKATAKWDREILVTDSDSGNTDFIWLPKEKLLFAQITWAGIDPIMRTVKATPNTLPESTVARFSHPSFSQLMSEYLVAHVINAERNFYKLYDGQRKSKWMDDFDWRQGTKSYRCLNELTVGILGVGEMGRDAAKRFKAFGCRTLGLVRTDPKDRCRDIDEYCLMPEGGLAKILQESDYICNVLPNTPETTNILGNGVLKQCSARHPTLINIGRSNVVSETELLTAIDSGWISGAVLDVFDKEPLPESHAFWRHPKVIVTPHVAAISRPQHVAECFRDNWERYHSEGEGRKGLRNVIDWNTLY